jgi:hypothetical protein
MALRVIVSACILGGVVLAASGCGSQAGPPLAPPSPRADAADRGAMAGITCNRNGIREASTRVNTQLDGVHLRFENTADTDLRYGVDHAQGGQGDTLPRGTSTIVVQAPAGELRVQCLGPGRYLDPGKAPTRIILVADPAGYAAGVQLECADKVVVGHGQHADTSSGQRGDPVELARRELGSRLRPADVVRRLWYAGPDEAVVIVQRDDRTVSRTEFRRLGKDDWLLEMTERCQSFNDSTD